jgi:predicted porin
MKRTLAAAGAASAQLSVTLFGVMDATISRYASTSRDPVAGAVSRSGSVGEVRLGRDYIPTFWNDTVFDPFGTNGVGTNLIFAANNFNTAGGAVGFGGNPNRLSVNYSIGYFLPPNLGDFYGQAPVRPA